jgi:2-C-methyl-D-erythritol 4-phosphate cytidylyltransferase
MSTDHLEHGKNLVEELFPEKKINCVIGGHTRFHSVKAGLESVKDAELVLVHDAVRCLITPSLIQRCMQQAKEKKSAIPTIVSKDSIRMITEDNENVQLDRSRIRLVQTPQVFTYDLLMNAFQADYQDRFTDEANVVEASGTSVHLIEGEEENIKITFPSDLLLAAHILQSRQS